MDGAAEAPTEAPGTALEAKEKDEHGLRLPLARVKKLVKADTDVKAIASEAAFLIAKATELFMEEVVGRGYSQSSKEGRSSLAYQDLASVVHEWEALAFLADIVPRKVKVTDLLAKADTSSGQG